MMEVHAGLTNLQRLQQRIEALMESLPEQFNRSIKNSRLRLRAWRRSKGLPPFAVYWVILNRRRDARDGWGTRAPRFPFYRPKTRTRQNLDDAIYFGMAAQYRRIVYTFHARAMALNAAHGMISGAVEGFRKMLRPYELDTGGNPFRDNFSRVIAYLKGFAFSFSAAQTDLQKLELEMRLYSPLPLRLIYEQDAEHPYGRLRWRWVADGAPESPLNDRRKRDLRLEKSIRMELTPFEQGRRRGVRRLKVFTEVLRRLRARIPAVIQKTLDLLKTEGIVIAFESLTTRSIA